MANDSTPLPDWEGRKHWAWQVFDRAWRPTGSWLTTLGVGYACFFGHLIGRPMDEPYAFVVLAFAASMFGLKTYEKTKGIA